VLSLVPSLGTIALPKACEPELSFSSNLYGMFLQDDWRLSDSLKEQIRSGVVVLASEADGKVQIVVAVTPDLTSRVKAGQIVKELAPMVGGGGGGRPDFAEAGGKQPEKIDEMLKAAESVVARLLSRVGAGG